MPKLHLPQRYASAIASLRDITAEQMNGLLVALRDATRPNYATIAETIKPSLVDGENLVYGIFSAYSARIEWDVTVDQLVEDILEAVRPLWSTPATDDEIATFRSRLRQLLTIESLGVVAKAGQVLNDYERRFQGAKVLSDLRPVFGERVEDGILGMGIVHVLRVTWDNATTDDDRDFYVGMTTADLAKLKKAVERAEAKASTLRNQLTQGGVRYMEGE